MAKKRISQLKVIFKLLKGEQQPMFLPCSLTRRGVLKAQTLQGCWLWYGGSMYMPDPRNNTLVIMQSAWPRLGET